MSEKPQLKKTNISNPEEEKKNAFIEMFMYACSDKIGNIRDLILELEGKDVFDNNPDKNNSQFHNAYLVKMIQENASNAKDSEIILLLCNRLYPFHGENDGDRFENYARNAYGKNSIINATWADIYSSLRKKAEDASRKLAKSLYTKVYKGDKRVALGIFESVEPRKCFARAKLIRKTYTNSEIESGTIGSDLLLNSIVDNTVMPEIDERDFMWARETYSPGEGEWKREIEIVGKESGYTILLRIYNDNTQYKENSGDINVKIAIRNVFASNFHLNGFIKFGSDKKITCWDFVKLTSEKGFRLEYVKGSATLCDESGKVEPSPINDDIFKEKGTPIKIEKLSQYWINGSCAIMFKVKTVRTDYIVEHKLRNINSNDLSDTAYTKPLDDVEIMIKYQRLSTKLSENKVDKNGNKRSVLIKESLADGLEYINRTTYINSDLIEDENICSNGIVIPDNTTSGTEIKIIFRARVTAQLADENSKELQNICCVSVFDMNLTATTTVLVDNSETKSVIATDDEEQDVDEDKAIDDISENPHINGMSEVAPENETIIPFTSPDKIDQLETTPNPDLTILPDETTKDVADDTALSQVPTEKSKAEKKAFRTKPCILGAAAIIVIILGVIIFPKLTPQPMIPPTESDDSWDNSAPNDYFINLDEFDSIMPNDPLLTSESSVSEDASVSNETTVPDETTASNDKSYLAIQIPDGLSWEKNGGGRFVYTTYQVDRGVLGNQVVLNSISDNDIIGDERNFVAACESTSDISTTSNEWEKDNITVENGKEYIIRAYIHNDNPLGFDAVATNTKIGFYIPDVSAKQIQVNGYISTDNTDPGELYDNINFSCAQAFQLKYVPGSAVLENDGIGKNGGIKLHDSVITQKTNDGVLIGYDDLDGQLPGGYEYQNYVTIRVKAVFDTNYKLENEVRLIGGAKTWGETVNAEIGDIVEFRMSYKNLHETESQDHVAVKYILPDSLEYIPNSTRLVNAKYLDGTGVSPDGNILKGFSIGSYDPTANAYVYLRAKVVDTNLECSGTPVSAWVQCSVGEVTLQNYADVVIYKSDDEVVIVQNPVATNLD